MPACRACATRVDDVDRYCRFCGRRLRIGAPRSRGIRGFRRREAQALVGMLVFAAVLLGILGLAPSPPGPPPPQLARLLLDVRGEVLADGSVRILITPPPEDNRTYTSFRVTWSASGPFRLEVGTWSNGCKWLSLGGSDACENVEAAAPAGALTVAENPPYPGNVWFRWGDVAADGQGLVVDYLVITGYWS